MTSDVSTLSLHLREIDFLISDERVDEIVINHPGSLIAETKEGWEHHDVPALTSEWCSDLARLVANFSSQEISEEHPLLGATMPDGSRIQVIEPPVSVDTSITIRIPSRTTLTLEQIVTGGAFDECRGVESLLMTSEDRKRVEKHLPAEKLQLLKLFKAGQWAEFLEMAVLEKMNIIFSGQTGSGKTTAANALCAFIPPAERIATVEDGAREMKLPHVNQVNLLYSRDGKGLARVTPKQIFEACLRIRPDRVLPAELRGEEAYFFIQNVLNSGHPGVVTTVHASSSKLAFRRLANMIQSSPEGRGMGQDTILEMLFSLLDIVVQTGKKPIGNNGGGKKVITEIYFDPAYALQQIG